LTHMEGLLVPAEPVPYDPIIFSSACNGYSWVLFVGNSHLSLVSFITGLGCLLATTVLLGYQGNSQGPVGLRS
jgi:hypothetical protein